MTGAAVGDDERFMRAALRYGRRGFGTTAPNPCVAALVVKDGVVRGRGVTAPGGRPHAEPLALEQAGEGARGATLYVTLEPCSHHGRTGPCTEAIVAAGVARVVAACGDPDPRVSGRGTAQLRAAGLAVETGLCRAEAAHDHAGHVRRSVDGRPAVTLKLAETADGYAAGSPGSPRLLITGDVANSWTHLARATHDAVLVGAGTARADDPLLTVRLPGLDGRRPARIVLDPRATLDPRSRLVATVSAASLTVLVGPGADPGRVENLRRAGASVMPVGAGPDGRLDLAAALRALGAQGIARLLCEGGPTLASALLEADLVDEVALLTGPDRLDGPGLPALTEAARALLRTGFHLAEARPLGRDRLRRHERTAPCSPA